MPWLDAAWHPAAWVEAAILPFDPADRGLLLGDGLFDTSLVLGGTMVWRDAHVARLVAGCRTLGFAVDPARIEGAIDGVLAHAREGAMRITVTRGVGPRGLAPPKDPRPTILATIAPLRTEALFAPLKLHVAEIRRNETSPLAQVKSLNYLDGVLAGRAALEAGCDDALLLNTQGAVACTTVGNLFAVLGGQLVTPPRVDGVLDGTVRGILLQTCDTLGLAPVERSLTLAELQRADAIFVTNSLRLVSPVATLDRRSIAGALRGAALMTHVAKLVYDETGVDPRALADV